MFPHLGAIKNKSERSRATVELAFGYTCLHVAAVQSRISMDGTALGIPAAACLLPSRVRRGQEDVRRMLSADARALREKEHARPLWSICSCMLPAHHACVCCCYSEG